MVTTWETGGMIKSPYTHGHNSYNLLTKLVDPSFEGTRVYLFFLVWCFCLKVLQLQPGFCRKISVDQRFPKKPGKPPALLCACFSRPREPGNVRFGVINPTPFVHRGCSPAKVNPHQNSETRPLLIGWAYQSGIPITSAFFSRLHFTCFR